MGELASSIKVRKHDEAASPVTLFKLLLNFYASVFLLPAPPSVFEEQPTHVDRHSVISQNHYEHLKDIKEDIVKYQKQIAEKINKG